MEKVQNLLSFSDFEKSWNPKKQKSTKKTETGLDVLEKRRMLLENDIEKDEFIDDDDIEDEDIESLDDEIDDDDDENWKQQLKSHIDQIIEDGVSPEDVYDFLDDITENDDDEENDDLEDLGSENEDDDLEDDDLEDEIFVEDEEGQDVQETVKNFRKWNK
jgi:DNA-binding transcriptional regulator YhcF (GntR family)